MKKHLLNWLAAGIASLTLFSCEKDENQVVFEGGSAPALTANRADTIPIAKITKDQQAIAFSWTNPNYSLNTGPSSQNVNYALQLRAQGTTDWVSVSSTTSAIQTSYTQGAFNDFLVKDKAAGGLGLEFGVPLLVEARVVSYLGALSNSNATNQASNILVFKTQAYSVIPDLWITGNATASSWTNTPPPPQKFSYDVPTKKFKITMNFTPGNYYKFLEVQGQWQPQWGGAPKTGGPISVNDGTGSDPDAIETPSAAGTYILTVDLNNKTLVITQ